MKEKIINIVNEFWEDKILKEEFLRKIEKVLKEENKQIEGLIDEIIENKDSDLLTYSLHFIYDLMNENNLINYIHKLILEPWHSEYEDMIHYLQDKKRTESISIIKKAIQQKNDYLESYDTGIGQFISQCGYALSSIGNKEAIKCITELSNSKDELIRNEMQYQLKRLSNHPDTENEELTKRWWS